MDSAEPGDVNVEYMYTRVMNEIGKAIDDGDIDRANAMAKRGAVGKPKVFPKLDPDIGEQVAP